MRTVQYPIYLVFNVCVILHVFFSSEDPEDSLDNLSLVATVLQDSAVPGVCLGTRGVYWVV